MARSFIRDFKSAPSITLKINQVETTTNPNNFLRCPGDTVLTISFALLNAGFPTSISIGALIKHHRTITINFTRNIAAFRAFESCQSLWSGHCQPGLNRLRPAVSQLNYNCETAGPYLK